MHQIPAGHGGDLWLKLLQGHAHQPYMQTLPRDVISTSYFSFGSCYSETTLQASGGQACNLHLVFCVGGMRSHQILQGDQASHNASFWKGRPKNHDDGQAFEVRGS